VEPRNLWKLKLKNKTMLKRKDISNFCDFVSWSANFHELEILLCTDFVILINASEYYTWLEFHGPSLSQIRLKPFSLSIREVRSICYMVNKVSAHRSQADFCGSRDHLRYVYFGR
jgi:hypothetical protein